MMPDQTSNSVSRGRTQATKPLTVTSASVTAPTVSTRAKSKPHVSANANSAETSSTSVATPKTKVVPPQTAAAPEAPCRLKSQPLKATLNKEPLVTKPVFVDPENNNSTNEKEATEDKQTEPSVTLQAPNDTAEPTDGGTSELAKAVEPSQTLPSTADPLQVAAQTYPWLYMSSTLDACFAETEKTVTKELEELEKKVTKDEAELAEEKLRYESERLIEFCDELGSDTFAKEAPTIMQSFISFGEVCERIEAEALQLAMSTPSLESEEPLQAFQTMMDSLDKLQEQASELESSILRLTNSSTVSSSTVPEIHKGPPTTIGNAEKDEVHNQETGQKLMEDAASARTQIMGVFTACLPVLRARIANLSMAQELIDSAQENFSLALRMESMGIE